MVIMTPFNARGKKCSDYFRMLPSMIWLIAYAAVIAFIFTGCPTISADTEPRADNSRNSGTYSPALNSKIFFKWSFDGKFSPIEKPEENARRKLGDVFLRDEQRLLEGSMDGPNQRTADNTAPATRTRRGFSASAQSLSQTCLENGCYRMIVDAMSWEGAQDHCRSQGGFLADKTQTQKLHEGSSNSSSSSSSSSSSRGLIWTGLTKYRNHYQWLTEFAEYCLHEKLEWDPAPPGLRPGPWLQGCPVFNVSSNKFHVTNCSEPLPFACFEGSQKEEEQISSGVELKLSHDYKGSNVEVIDNVTWLNLSSDEFKLLQLTCNFYNKSTGEKLDVKNAIIHWTKDETFLQERISTIRVAKVRDVMKEKNIGINTPPENKLPINQGNYQCESWLPNTSQLVTSNKVLVTGTIWTTYIISAAVIEPSDHSPDDNALSRTLTGVFSSVLSGWDSLTKNLINVQREQLNNGSYITTYNFHTYWRAAYATQRLLSDLNRKLQMTYPHNSSVKTPFHCSEEKEDVGFGNVVKWPSSDTGPVSSEKVQCRAENGLPIQGTCRWDFSKGAYLEKPSVEKCDYVGLCPRGYSTVHNIYCVAITSAGSWETGFRQAYTTSKESNLLDVLRNSVQNTKFFMDILLKERNASAAWLPIRRVTKHSPLLHIGYTNSNFTLGTPEIEQSFNVSWAPGHPLIMKDCLALDLTSLQLSSRDCNESLPFISIVDVSVLEDGLKSDEKTANSLGLTETLLDSECNKIGGFTPGYNTDTRICITTKQITRPSSWKYAYDRCDGDLPQPGRRFMTWIYQKLLVDRKLSGVYMVIGNGNNALPVNDSQIQYYNWLQGTNMDNSFGVIRRSGWALINDSLSNVRIQFCEKKLEIDTDYDIFLEINNNPHKIDVSFSPYLSGPVRNSLGCFINGRIVKPTFLGDGTVEVNVEDNHFGSCVCFIWKSNPVMWIKSNELFFRQSSYAIYLIKLLDIHDTYQPTIHDSTFFLDRTRTRCQNALLNELAKNVTLENITSSHVLYSPEELNGGVSQLISLQIPYSSNDINSIDEALSYQFPDHLLPHSIRDANCSVLQIRKTGGCRKVVVTEPLSRRNITFDRTIGSGGFLSDELCINHDGEPVTRQCYRDDIEGFYWSPTISGQCSTFSSSNVTRQLMEIQKNLEDGIIESDSVLNVITNSSELLPIDIISTINTLWETKLYYDENKEKTNTLKFKDLVALVDTVVAANKSHFESLDPSLNLTNKFLTYFETSSFAVEMDKGDYFKEESKKLFASKRVDVDIDSLIVGYSAKKWNEKSDEKILTRNQVNSTRQGVKAEVIFPENLIRSLIEASNNKSTKLQTLFSASRTGNLFQRKTSNYRLNSVVIQVSFKGYPVRDLNKSDYIRLRFEPLTDDKPLVCGFWNLTENNELGGWSTKGCWMGDSNGSLVTCFCNHLTSFALLINTGSVDIGQHHTLILDTITYIGCCLSIFGLLLVFLTFGLFKAWRQSKSNIILVNLSIAVFCSLALFLGGIDQTDNPILCRGVAASLHYFILASFCWMVVEAFHQYLRFVKVIGGYIPRFMWKASAFAWGLPLLPVVIILMIDNRLYESTGEFDTHTKICWISAKAFNYAFLIPLVFVMIVNLVFYIIIMKSVCKKSQMRSNLNERDLIIKKVNMGLCVFFLLGFTWIFGILMIIRGSETIFAYLFSIFNTLQGFSIFILFVWREKSARGRWSDLFAVMRSNNDDDTQEQRVSDRRLPETLECTARRFERTRLVSEEPYFMSQSSMAYD